jgi:1-acylglycerone phosphate reductase
MSKPTVLITGCSDGGLGSALALTLHGTGHRVFATARNPAKLANAKAAGIETVILDVLSESSIEKCVAEVRELTGGSLDVLVNNAGATYYSPLADASITECKKLFDLNVWANLTTIQAFLPLLLKSTCGGVIANHTSIAAVLSPPFMSVYGASKAAMATMTTSLRTELAPFGIKVVELRTGATKSNINENEGNPGISNKSLYYSAREWLDGFLQGKSLQEGATAADVWAKQVAAALTQRDPPDHIWAGNWAWTVWLGSCLPNSAANMIGRSVARMDIVEKDIQKYGKQKAMADAYGEQ